MVCRKTARMMARPTAASAAATVITKNTMTLAADPVVPGERDER